MKNLLLTLIISFCFQLSFSQTMFNNRIDFGFAAQYITSLVATDSCYYAIGNDVVTTSPWRQGIFFAIFDLEGELISIKTYDSFNGKGIELSHNKLFYSDGFFYCSAYFLYSNNFIKPVLIKLDSLGDTIFIKEYNSNFEYDTWHQAREGILGLDDNFYLTSQIKVLPEYKHNSDIIKISKSGNRIWSKLPLPLDDNGLHRMANSLVHNVRVHRTSSNVLNIQTNLC